MDTSTVKPLVSAAVKAGFRSWKPKSAKAKTTKAKITTWQDVVVIVLTETLKILFERRRQRRQERQREEQAQQQRQEFEMQIRADVASNVASELRPRVADDYAKLARGMIEQLRQHVGAAVTSVEADINKSREEIESKQHTADERKNELRAAIDALTKAKQPLEVSA